jgi:hypothetical protein
MSRRTHTSTNSDSDLRPRRAHAARPAGDANRHEDDRLPRLALIQPVAKTALTPGTVVWAHIPFEETDGSKLRPAVVSHLSGRDVTVYPATTTDKRHRYHRQYRELGDLGSAGLRRATGVELAAITIDVIDVVGVAGALGPDDRAAVLGAGHDGHGSGMAEAA